jgi:hypothetical protein
MVMKRADGSQTIYLTVEYVTDVACLLGIWRVLGPALRPFRKNIVRNSTFGVPFQPEAECESRVRINAITGGRTHLSRSSRRHLRIALFASTKSS